MDIHLFRTNRSTDPPMISTKAVNRILLRSIVFFVALVLLVLTIFYLTLRSTTQRSYIDTSYHNMISLLDQSDTTMQNTMSELEVHCKMILQNSSVTRLMISETPVFDLYCDASDQLTVLQKSNPITSDAWLYLCNSGKVLTTARTLLERDECGSSFAKAVENEPGLKLVDGELYYIVNYPSAEPLAKLVVRVETTALFRKVHNSYLNIYIYDSDMNPLFASLIHYPTGDGLEIRQVLKESEDGAMYETAEGNYIALYTSDHGDFNYLMRTAAVTLTMDNRSILKLWMPCALIILLAAVAYSLFNFSNIYRPIQSMLDTIVRGSASSDTSGNLSGSPFLHLGQTWTDTVRKNEALSETLSEVSPSVALHLLRRIIRDDFSDEETIRSTIPMIRNVFPPDRGFMLISLQPRDAENQTLNELYRSFYLMHLRALSRDFWQGHFPCLIDEVDSEELLLILSCGERDPQELKRMAMEFRLQLEKSTGEMPYIPVIAIGSLTEGMENLHTAYMNLRQEVQRQLYYPGENPKEETSTDKLVMEYREKTRNLIDSAMRQSSKTAGQLRNLERFPEGQDMSLVFQAIHLEVIEKLLNCSMDFAQFDFLNKNYLDNPSALTDTRENREYIHELLTQIVEVFEKYGNQSRNRYLNDAKSYIAQNYNDIELSLDKVGRHVGISGPYLSSTFSELQGQHFVDYLNNYRIEKAQMLLRATDLSVAEIGLRTGFSSANNFIRVFKKLIGQTPGAYRTQLRKENLH